MGAWISIEDSLPDFEEVILFTDGCKVAIGEYNSSNQNEYHHLSGLNVDDECFNDISRNSCCFRVDYCAWGIDVDHITHWMPLPELPKVKDKFCPCCKNEVVACLCL